MRLQIFLAAAAYLTLTSSFTLSPTSLPSKTFKTTLHSRFSESASSLPLSRSNFLQSASLVAFGLAGLPSNSVAAGGVTSEDIVRLKKGKAGTFKDYKNPCHVGVCNSALEIRRSED